MAATSFSWSRWNTSPRPEPSSHYWLATYVHDYLYQRTWLPRDYADSILDEAMESLGVKTDLRLKIYEGVRIGGWVNFDKDRQALAAEEAAQRKVAPPAGI